MTASEAAPTHEALLGLMVPIDSVTRFAGNARTHDLDTIRASLRVNGQYRPIVVNRGSATGRRNEVLAGNGTHEAAQAEGWSAIAVTFVDVDHDAATRIVLADNRANDLAGYDDTALLALLQDIPDLDGTGWAPDDLDILLAKVAPPAPHPDTAAGEVPPVPITQAGDIWRLGAHRVICGDCRDPQVVARLMAGRAINVAVTSPPYADRREYDPESGFLPIPPEEYVEWFAPVAANVADHLAPDGSWFVNIKPGVTPDGLDTELYVLDLVLAHVRRWGWHFATEFCWERQGVPKSVTRRFKNQFEPVYQFTRGLWKMRPDSVRHLSANVPKAGGKGVGSTNWADRQGGKASLFGADKRREHGTGSVMSDVQGGNFEPGEFIGEGLAYPGNRLPSFTHSHDATGHTAAFPVGLPAFFIAAYTDPEDAVYDPFVGSGSTILAAEETGRAGFGCELSAGYVDVTCRRWQEHTGQVPVLDATGEPVNFA